jgi:hypothetical protein
MRNTLDKCTQYEEMKFGNELPAQIKKCTLQYNQNMSFVAMQINILVLFTCQKIMRWSEKVPLFLLNCALLNILSDGGGERKRERETNLGSNEPIAIQEIYSLSC